MVKGHTLFRAVGTDDAFIQRWWEAECQNGHSSDISGDSCLTETFSVNPFFQVAKIGHTSRVRRPWCSLLRRLVVARG